MQDYNYMSNQKMTSSDWEVHRIWRDKEPILSIVMTAYNREKLLENTLRRMAALKYDAKTEVIIVDDKSTIPVNIDREYPFSITLVRRISRKDYLNPARAFNEGIRYIRGNVVTLQNAECFHMINIMDSVVPDIDALEIRSLACYALDQGTTLNLDINNPQMNYKEGQPNDLLSEGWYNHSVHRPVGYHFCNIYGTEIFQKLRGFDPLFYLGYCFDDDELLYRSLNLGRFTFDDENIVLHQWHYVSGAMTPGNFGFFRNKMLFLLVTKRKFPSSLAKLCAYALYPIFKIYKFVKTSV